MSFETITLVEDTPTIQLVRQFLELLKEGDPPSLIQLSKALDKLAVAYHETPVGDPTEDDVDCPRDDWKARYKTLASRFPDLGYYGVADPLEVPNTEPMTGDAIDDLADIAGDLEEVLWRFERDGADEGHWYFRMLFEIHWGRHLRELQLYLHAKLT